MKANELKPYTNYIEVTAFRGESEFVETCEDAKEVALEMSQKYNSECFCFMGELLIGETKPVGAKYEYRDVTPSVDECCSWAYPDMYMAE